MTTLPLKISLSLVPGNNTPRLIVIHSYFSFVQTVRDAIMELHITDDFQTRFPEVYADYIDSARGYSEPPPETGSDESLY